MTFNDQTCYRALAARDVRFDGLFFVGVTTTGIYCRPVCTARTPGRDRCRFFANAALAERHGFRPCLRCRPELATGHAPIDAVANLARQAAARIEAGALNDSGGIEQLAADMHVSSRQLRRAVRQEFGVSPVELAQTNRLLMAKQLLVESNLPLIDVAHASGFASVRRFNALFREHYGLVPSRVRSLRRSAAGGDHLKLTLTYRPPFAWPELLRFLAGRATAGVESIVGDSYLRTVALGDARGWLRVEPVRGKYALSVELATSLAAVLPKVLSRLRHLFDLAARPDVIDSHLAGDPRLAEFVERTPGLRVPGAFCGFELAVRAILGQQVSVAAATTLAGRLADRFGEPIETPFPQLKRLTPNPARLTAASFSEMTRLGILKSRAQCIRDLARSVSGGLISLEQGANPEPVIEKLLTIRGIGDWTGGYIALRALRWPDALPAGDLGLIRATGATSPAALREMAEAWRPWRSYAAMHFWNSPTEPARSDHVNEQILSPVSQSHRQPVAGLGRRRSDGPVHVRPQRETGAGTGVASQ
ncbi:MAG TPA: AlkA N-terminal domain-containing protein [Planctomycetaceae bacterium]|jgi:AraC family transcriptional regulator of adaptative response / DNA-3-methyladenine glycosylase II